MSAENKAKFRNEMFCLKKSVLVVSNFPSVCMSLEARASGKLAKGVYDAFALSLRNFLVVFILKGGATFGGTVLVQNLSGKHKQYGIGAFKSLYFRRQRTSVSALLKESFGASTLRFAAFCALYSGSFKLLVTLLEWLRKKNDGYNSLIAGALAGTTFLIDTNKERRSEIALTLFARALSIIYRAGATKGRIY